jgi:hypothetical protein
MSRDYGRPIARRDVQCRNQCVFESCGFRKIVVNGWKDGL